MVLAHNSLLPIAHLFFLAAIAWLFFHTEHKRNKNESSLRSEAEDLQGRINIAYQQLELEESRNKASSAKLKKYEALAAFTETLNQNLSLEDTVKTLLDQSFTLLGAERSLCMLYLAIDSAQGLSLMGAKGSSPDAGIIKDKQGDVFDEWVMRHAQPLLVEDTLKDFRFDAGRLRAAVKRRIGSVISSCLISQNHPIGVLRLEDPSPGIFSLEDLRLLSTICDIAGVAVDNARYYQRTRELAIRDSLTAAFTRAFTLERLNEEIQRAMLTNDTVSILMLDIDFFKRYNDTYGHIAGDAVLRSLGQWLNAYFLNRGAVIGRYGGEEFLLILPSSSKEEAFSLAENFRASIQERTVSLRRNPTRITLSIGIAACPQDAQELDALISNADSALYKAKRTGRNRVCLF
jgi:diguanylate cyclase (GGDEF)-like protein